MRASTDVPPVTQAGLIYERKYDGMRVLVELEPPVGRKTAPRVWIYSRTGHEKSRQFPAVTAALATWATRLAQPVVLDGELVAVSPKGVPLGFQQLQSRIALTGAAEIARAEHAQPAAVIFFDVLRIGGRDLRGKPLAARRLDLQHLFEDVTGRDAHALIRLSEIAKDDGRAMLARARQEGWEGLIVKEGRSRYHSGRRTPAWRKLKLLAQQEFVIGGWTAPRQSRAHFGSILVGYRQGADLVFAGSVGTGFTQAELDRLAALFARRTRATSPFANRVVSHEAPHFITPDLVCEVKFIEWTGDGRLRQPVYLGLRDDTRAAAVHREPEPANSGLFRDGPVTLPNGDTLRFTNLRKTLWPTPGLTKGDLIRYYHDVADLILPAVDDRPLVMKRSPNGVDAPSFYQQRHTAATPKGVRTALVHGDEHLIGGSLTTLLYMAQLAAISQDPWFSRVSDPAHMDYAAIDLDPGEGATFADVIDVARWTHDELERLDIPAVPKTSGARGVHIYIPLPKKTTYETGQRLCRLVATLVCAKHPKQATIERRVTTRSAGTVYLDYLQNILGKTLATAYSARASDYAGVSTPLAWTEVTRRLDPRDFTITTAPQRFREVGDLWQPMRTLTPVNIKRVLTRLTGHS